MFFLPCSRKHLAAFYGFTMMNFIITLLFLAISQPNALLFDFSTKQDGQNWVVINDDVMGGRSSGQLDMNEEALLFTGKLSLANNGGFASLRSPWSRYDLSDYETVVMRVRGKGGEFGITLEVSKAYYEPNFRFLFTPGEEWTELEIPMNQFEKTRLGSSMGDRLNPKQAANIIRIGFIKSDKRTEDFALEIDYLRFQ